MDIILSSQSHIHATALVLRIITIAAILLMLNTTEEAREPYRPYINALVAVVAVTWFLAVFRSVVNGSAVMGF